MDEVKRHPMYRPFHARNDVKRKQKTLKSKCLFEQ